MKKAISCVVFSHLLVVLFCFSVAAQTEQTITDKKYHEQIRQLWNQKKAQYTAMVTKSGENPDTLYNIQGETNNLLKYSAYCRQYDILNELIALYLQSLNTLTETDQYVYAYYPEGQKRSVQRLKKKFRMWVSNEKPVGREVILDSSQFLYLLSDTVSIIVDIPKEKRTPVMQEALNKFIPLLVEHYNRWIFDSPGPFQVRGWGCRYNGKHLPAGMTHMEYINKKIDKKLGNGDSPSYCNSVSDVDMWIIAGVANILTVYQKDKALVPITSNEYKNFLSYLKTGINLLESRFSYTRLKNIEDKPVVGALFDAGAFDDHVDFTHAGYSGKDHPLALRGKSMYQGKGTGWDLSHARRLVHVYSTLLKARDVLGLNYPTKAHMEKMANQLIYGTFNRDFKKPLFTNFMDGSNGWYRIGFSGREGFGYGPSDLSLAVFEGGYGFWSVYNPDIKKVFLEFRDMLQSDDPSIRKHIVDHYETNFYIKFKRPHDINFKDSNNSNTQAVLIKFLPAMCFMVSH